MKIDSVLINLNFTFCIVHKCVLIVCELASLLLDALNLVKELGYCTANRQISCGTIACKNTQTRLPSVAGASLVILLACVLEIELPVHLHRLRSLLFLIKLCLGAPALPCVRVTYSTPALLNLAGILGQMGHLKTHAIFSPGKQFMGKKRK